MSTKTTSLMLFSSFYLHHFANYINKRQIIHVDVNILMMTRSPQNQFWRKLHHWCFFFRCWRKLHHWCFFRRKFNWTSIYSSWSRLAQNRCWPKLHHWCCFRQEFNHNNIGLLLMIPYAPVPDRYSTYRLHCHQTRFVHHQLTIE